MRAATTSSCSTPCSSGLGTSSTTTATLPRPAADRVAVVGARADRRPHLRQDLRRRQRFLATSAATTTTSSAARRRAPRLVRGPAARRPGMIAKGEELKDELLDHPAVRDWIASLWGELKRPRSTRHRRPRQRAAPSPRLRCHGSATACRRPELQAKIDDWVAAATYVVEHYRGEVSRHDLVHRRQVGRRPPADGSSSRSAATCSSSASTARSWAASPAWPSTVNQLVF